MTKTSGILWAAIAGVAAIFLVGAWLGLSALEPQATQASVRPASGKYAAYVAPDSVCPGSRALGAPVADQQATMLCLLNYARTRRGIGQLATSQPLMHSARIKADDIARCGEFSHTACGATVVSAFERASYVSPYESSSYGENLAWGATDAGSPRGALLGWLDSDEHRENLFKADWTEQGIALVYVGEFRGIADSRVWVSHFGRRG